MDINFHLGRNIKELRKKMNLSQKELAEGICSQAYISQIEKGEVSLSADYLFLIAHRLNTGIRYLLELSYFPRMDYIYEVINIIRTKTKNKQFKEVLEMIQTERKNPLFEKDIHNKQFLLWHEAICLYYLENSSVKALTLLDKAIDLTNIKDNFTERELEILLSKGIIFSEQKNFEEAIEVYHLCLKKLKNLPQMKDYKIHIRILYNLTKTLTDYNKLKIALEYVDQGIQACIKQESLYLLPELFFQKGRIHKSLLDYKNCINNMEKAKFLFEITNRTQYNDAIDEIILNIYN